jgi:SiaC family regulatory phosphoprotein
MEPLRIQATIKTPEILFDPSNNVFEIKGKSIPDNAEDFYTSILDWFDDYVANPLSETVLKIDLEYFNISSSKRLLFLLYKLNELADSENLVKVQWHYNEQDEDMFEVGQDYAFMVKFPFDFISYAINESTLVEAS